MATKKRRNGTRRRNGPRKKTLKGAWRAIPSWLKIGGLAAGALGVINAVKKARE